MSEIIQYDPSYILVGPLQVSPKDIELCKKIMINDEEEKQLRDVLKRSSKNTQPLLLNTIKTNQYI